MAIATKPRSIKGVKFHYEKAAAAHAVDFFQNYLCLTKGEWAGDPFILLPWQRKRIIEPLFGWKRPDGTRKYRTVYVEIPRKNAKSELAAGVALYMLTADGEPGGEVYGAAVDRPQARIIFERCVEMRRRSPALRKITTAFRQSLTYGRTQSVYRTLSADAFNKDGLNASAVIFDEFHAQKSRELYDVLDTSQGSRRQPLMFIITTAGFDKNSICWELHDYAVKVFLGLIKDDSFLPVIYPEPSKDDGKKEIDWTSPKEWKRANPNYGVSIKSDYLARMCVKAQRLSGFENAFRRLHLNQWTEQDARWMRMKTWDDSAGEVDGEDLRGKSCYAGLDLATSYDIASLVLTFQVGEDYKLLPFFWIPEANMRERVKKDRVPYDIWVRDGLITATEGDVIDYNVIFKDIKALREIYNIREIAYDRWGAAKLSTDLEDEGFTVVPFGQGFGSMSAPTKELMALTLQGRLHHGANPVLRWMANNVVVKEDPAGNMKPNKAKSTARIDGIVAGIMGLDRCIRHEGGTGKSIYDEREPRSL